MSHVALRVGVWLAIVGAVAGAGLYWAGTEAAMGDQQGAVWEVIVPLVVAAAVVVTWTLVHHLRGREPRVEPVREIPQPPSDHTPAEVGWLVGFGVTTPRHIAATLVSLQDRDVIGVAPDSGVLTRTENSEVALLPHERRVLAWLFENGVQTTVDVTAARIKTAPRSWQRFFEDFSHALDEHGAASGLVERAADTEEVLSVGLLSSSVIVAGAIGVARISPVWLTCTAAGALVLVFADTLARRSPQGAVLAARWQQFCRSLATADSDTVAANAAYALALNAASQLPLTPEQRLLADAAHRWENAYTTAAAFLAGPTLAIPHRRRDR